jgi:hypothetical protein
VKNAVPGAVCVPICRRIRPREGRIPRSALKTHSRPPNTTNETRCSESDAAVAAAGTGRTEVREREVRWPQGSGRNIAGSQSKPSSKQHCQIMSASQHLLHAQAPAHPLKCVCTQSFTSVVCLSPWKLNSFPRPSLQRQMLKRTTYCLL